MLVYIHVCEQEPTKGIKGWIEDFFPVLSDISFPCLFRSGHTGQQSHSMGLVGASLHWLWPDLGLENRKCCLTWPQGFLQECERHSFWALEQRAWADFFWAICRWLWVQSSDAGYQHPFHAPPEVGASEQLAVTNVTGSWVLLPLGEVVCGWA